MKIVVGGSSGLIGTALVDRLRADGHAVTRLVRRPPDGPDERHWDPAAGALDPGALDGADAVVNLCGVGIGDRRWTERRKRELATSRVDPTDLLARTMADLGPAGPHVLVNASAVGYYGDRGDDVLTEDEPAGDDFAARMCTAWEAAADPARAAGIRVVHPRSAIVLSDRGGALGRQLPLFRLGLGGALAGGRWWEPWISLTDEVGALAHLLHADVEGPVNLVGPESVTNAEFTRALAARLHRPALLPVPRFALRLALGELAGAITASIRTSPDLLIATGFRHRHATVAAALADEIG